MFKYCNLLFYRPDIRHVTLGHLSSSAVVREKWDLLTAVCLERKPLITTPLLKIEEDYKHLQSQIEFERSLKSDHEVRHEKEQKQLEQLKKGADIEVHLKDTAQDLVDASTEEFSKFKFASRVTEADKKNDLKSLNRKLDKHLVLVTKQKIGKDNFYLLPQALRQDGETLRQTAERIVKDTCGGNLKAMIYGNAPSAFYKYKYPSIARKDAVGAKVFIYFARYEKGQLENEKVDYKWLDREELAKSLPNDYVKSVSQMLIDE
ncbi:39S ribosomal protein L46, mitochondrial [Tribolium madens]|uniref:39S ribosomal protein L46, mitochondrial n=1 Tax=Tribolium madens TaxID=41895 RepID=UPI001CF75317|nr:39S ribosomal protein L46, mitochondrial [Tribolium madens]